MARVPISFYLNILAGIFVLFNHYASSETGDFALNKVTGAAGRFYNVFRESVITLQHGCISRLESVICGPTSDSLLPRDVAEYLRVRYCDSDTPGGTSHNRELHGGYGSSEVAFMYPSMRPPLASAKGSSRQSLLGPGWSTQTHFSRAAWDWPTKVMMTIGPLFSRTYASYWWFKAPLKVTSVLVACSALLGFGCWIGVNVLPRFIFQTYMAVVVDFLRCIEWEAQRRIFDISAVTMVQVYDALAVPYARRCA